jgi:beta-1,2-mannobiose phosphorylase / 1,2-beta-oligomannan phosphorylase
MDEDLMGRNDQEANRCEVRDRRPLTLEAREPLASMYVLSPYVWSQATSFEIALRAVNHSNDPDKKVARVYHGRSRDGLHFKMDREPILTPGPHHQDAGGCEDPSVVLDGGDYILYYSGYDPIRREASLLWAHGRSLDTLVKQGAVLPGAAYRQTKEATPLELSDRSWCLFFEYALDERSMIGMARASTPTGPWTTMEFPLTARPGHWDAWHLSPGPVVQTSSGRTVMFYNGATRAPQWRIGWLELAPDCRSIVARSAEPLIEPGPVSGDATDIAFAASAVCLGADVHLYYTISDMTLMRAVIGSLG